MNQARRRGRAPRTVPARAPRGLGPEARVRFMARAYDAIVIGLGAMGSAALRALSRRGWRGLGLHRFPPPHDRGSSHGQSRIIREADFEDPSYVSPVRQIGRAHA